MLEAVRRPPAEETLTETRTRGHDLTEFLLDVLAGVGSYDGLIREAEGRGDPELAGFLRELRRQDVVRARGATGLLRRPLEGMDGKR